MTPEQIAEARWLVAEANLWSDTSVEEWADFASQAKRIVPQLLDALDAAAETNAALVRERDEARTALGEQIWRAGVKWSSEETTRLTTERDAARARLAEVEQNLDRMMRDHSKWVHTAMKEREESSAARAQVETLVVALREIAEDAIDIDGRNGDRARAALKAAGVEPRLTKKRY